MKCLACNGRGSTGIPSFVYACKECGCSGQVGPETYVRQNMTRAKKFWTPAERAGLKAMGREYHWWKNADDSRKDEIRGALSGLKYGIRAYVQAARKIKEAK